MIIYQHPLKKNILEENRKLFDEQSKIINDL